ncbi:MAG TPA: hypothetical protein VIQ74_07025 [Gemmatimonadaceae bacterium]
MSNHEASPHGDQSAPDNSVNCGSHVALDEFLSLQRPVARRLSAILPGAVEGEVETSAE